MNKDTLADTQQDDRVLWELRKPNWDEWESAEKAKLATILETFLESNPCNKKK